MSARALMPGSAFRVRAANIGDALSWVALFLRDLRSRHHLVIKVADKVAAADVLPRILGAKNSVPFGEVGNISVCVHAHTHVCVRCVVCGAWCACVCNGA